MRIDISEKEVLRGIWLMYNGSKKNHTHTHTRIYFNTNYSKEMKLIPINMVYCLLQFDVLYVFFGVRLDGKSLTLIFFNVNYQI